MPNIKSAIKRVSVIEKKTLRNNMIKSEYKTAIKRFEEALNNNNIEEATKLFSEATKKIDQACTKGVIVKNTASRKKSNLAKRPVKRLLKEYYLKVDSFYEKLVRENHAKNSATEIRNRHELGFIDSALREIVAEVSEAHGYNVNDIYKIKSTASSKLWSQKFTKIILRLADLLDMSNYRVSALVLNHNLDNMGDTSRFHWLSHLITKGYEIETDYYLDENKTVNFLEKNSIVEKIMLRVDVELPQLTHENPYGCKEMGLESIDKTAIKVKCGETCTSDKCNFLCKWFVQKNYYLFLELASLQDYLESLPDNYFKPEIEVVVNSSDKNKLSSKQFTLLKKYVDGR